MFAVVIHHSLECLLEWETRISPVFLAVFYDYFPSCFLPNWNTDKLCAEIYAGAWGHKTDMYVPEIKDAGCKFFFPWTLLHTLRIIAIGSVADPEMVHLK